MLCWRMACTNIRKHQITTHIQEINPNLSIEQIQGLVNSTSK